MRHKGDELPRNWPSCLCGNLLLYPRTSEISTHWKHVCMLHGPSTNIRIYFSRSYPCKFLTSVTQSSPTIMNASMDIQGGAKKRGHRPSYLIVNISKTSWPNCMEIGGLLQYYMLNTVINFLFKNFISLWRHLAKTPLLSFIHTVYK